MLHRTLGNLAADPDILRFQKAREEKSPCVVDGIVRSILSKRGCKCGNCTGLVGTDDLGKPRQTAVLCIRSKERGYITPPQDCPDWEQIKK